MTDQQL